VAKNWEARFTPPEYMPPPLQRLFTLSIVVAAVGAILPWAFQMLEFSAWAWLGSLCLAGLWLILLIVALAKFKKRGFWLLIGAPFALFAPFALWVASGLTGL